MRFVPTRLHAIVVLVSVGLIGTSAQAQTQSFQTTYVGQGFFASSCNSTFNIVGEEPTTGTHPVFLWFVGTFEPSISDVPSLAAIDGMAARGFVAASIQYDNPEFGTCGQIGGKTKCIFDPTNATSAVSVLCARPTADCSKGIVVGGLSQGSIIVDLAKNYDPRVRAGWGMGDGTTYSVYNLASCVTPANRALPMDRLRVVNGEEDNYLSGSDQSRTQSELVTGYDCGPTAFDCLQPDGSGYYIVQDSQVDDGQADHCYWGEGGCFNSISTLDPGWQSGSDPWELNANLDWLAGFGGSCGDGVVQPALDEQCDLGASNGAAGSCCTASCTFVSSGTVCRAQAGVCDAGETCTGTSATCPPDAFAPSTAVCRVPAGACDVAELCTGTSTVCPPDAKSTAVCRPSAGECDLTESCSGTGDTCPPDAKKPNGTACTNDGNPCTADICNGASDGCQHPAGNAGAVCRPGSGDVCDPDEVCTGLATTCPPDVVLPATIECRPAAGECDIRETCGGLPAQPCPADVKKAAGAACTADTNPCTRDQCDGTSNGCQHPAGNAGVECRASAGVCDAAETCTGTSTACPPDAKRTAVCRPSAAACDATESCDGVADDCPPDAFAPSSTVCRPSAGECDITETCTGSDPSCPADTKRPSGFACSPDGNPCTLDQCDGTGDVCQHPAGNAGVVCRVSAGTCDVAETCDGASTACPSDAAAPDGTPCDDGNPCTTPDGCQSGVCTGTPDPVACADHYLCYKASLRGVTALPNVHLVDEFEDVAVAVVKPRNLCTPADENGEGVTDANTHLESYAIKEAVPATPRVRTVANHFGTLSLTTTRPDLLLVPTAKSLASTPSPPANATIGVDHYKCYKVKVTPGTPRLPKGVQAAVADQFNSPPKIFDVRKPRHLCNPVDKNGEGVKNADAHLVCYTVQGASGQPRHARRHLFVANQFDPETGTTVKESELCVPSTSTP